jgi:succinate-semialdehyde dehydrogenase/glutarate-semialdehyde dehydrogenase
MTVFSINPATEERVAEYTEHSADEIEKILEGASEAYRAWRATGFAERAARMNAAAQILRASQEQYARLMAGEMGKPLQQGRSEVEKCAWVCDYYADQAAHFLEPELVKTDASRSVVVFEPLGILLAVMPWNFPFWQVFRAAVPAMMAGNSVVLKHASNVFGCGLAIEDLFARAGFPTALFRTLLVRSGRVNDLIDNPLIRAVTLTGSAAAGKAVAAKAGQALKKTVLELGGSDPYLILEDANLEQAAHFCAVSRLINSGQSCIAAKRFIVIDKVRPQFEKLFVGHMGAARMGDPLQEGITVGPLARQDLRETLHQQVQRSISQGARVLLGGSIPQGKGTFYPPTVLSEVKKRMPVYDEETFGPVAAIIDVANEAEAIRTANDSSFGLGAAVFTSSIERGERVAAQLEAGCCFVNDYVRSDPRLPFGGLKESGYGRELAIFGIREFVNIKTIYAK